MRQFSPPPNEEKIRPPFASTTPPFSSDAPHYVSHPYFLQPQPLAGASYATYGPNAPKNLLTPSAMRGAALPPGMPLRFPHSIPSQSVVAQTTTSKLPRGAMPMHPRHLPQRPPYLSYLPTDSQSKPNIRQLSPPPYLLSNRGAPMAGRSPGPAPHHSQPMQTSSPYSHPPRQPFPLSSLPLNPKDRFASLAAAAADRLSNATQKPNSTALPLRRPPAPPPHALHSPGATAPLPSVSPQDIMTSYICERGMQCIQSLRLNTLEEPAQVFHFLQEALLGWTQEIWRLCIEASKDRIDANYRFLSAHCKEDFRNLIFLENIKEVENETKKEFDQQRKERNRQLATKQEASSKEKKKKGKKTVEEEDDEHPSGMTNETTEVRRQGIVSAGLDESMDALRDVGIGGVGEFTSTEGEKYHEPVTPLERAREAATVNHRQAELTREVGLRDVRTVFESSKCTLPAQMRLLLLRLLEIRNFGNQGRPCSQIAAEERQAAARREEFHASYSPSNPYADSLLGLDDSKANGAKRKRQRVWRSRGKKRLKMDDNTNTADSTNNSANSSVVHSSLTSPEDGGSSRRMLLGNSLSGPPRPVHASGSGGGSSSFLLGSSLSYPFTTPNSSEGTQFALRNTSPPPPPQQQQQPPGRPPPFHMSYPSNMST